MKDVRSQGRRICPVQTFCGQGEGVLQMWMSVLLGAKNIGISKFMVCPHG